MTCELLDDGVATVGCITYQLVEWKTVGVAVMISVCENPVISSALGPVQSLDFSVVLTVQRSLTCCLVLEQLHLILGIQRERDGEDVGFINRTNSGKFRFLQREVKN